MDSDKETIAVMRKEFPSRDLFEVEDRGYHACGIELNYDVLCVILGLVPLDDLVFNCRLVCKAWCNIIDTSVLRGKLNYSVYRQERLMRTLPWHLVYWILKKKCLNRNLFNKNSDGKGKLEDLEKGGNMWTAEEPPNTLSSEVVIDLVKEGAPRDLLDNFQPVIRVSECYFGKVDGRVLYWMEVDLITETGVVVDKFLFKGDCCDRRWLSYVYHEFRNYGPGVRYVRYKHVGEDEQFWPYYSNIILTGVSVIALHL